MAVMKNLAIITDKT